MHKRKDKRLYLKLHIKLNPGLKGIVKRKIDISKEHRRYGLGIELTKQDFRCIALLGSLLGSSDTKNVKMMLEH